MEAALDYFMIPATVSAFLQVVMIDLVLAGDNAVVVGMAAAGLSKKDRRKAIMVGIAAATVLRILFALMASYLLSIIGLLLAGGLLLLWVCWKMWRELRDQQAEEIVAEGGSPSAPRKNYREAMSLDNVLAVAGAAHEHPVVLVFGLCLSVVLMGFAASLIAGLLNRHRWIAYGGLAIILFVAVEMIWRGGIDVAYAL